jgi:integrase/recombinase XerD
VLSPAQVRHAFRVARARGRHAARAETALAMSIGLGLRAKELAGLKWADVYDAEGKVRPIVHLRAAYTKGGRTRDVFVSSPAAQLKGRRDDAWFDGAISEDALRRGRDTRCVIA